MSSGTPPTLLCTANFPAGAGYAWDFIESLYAGVSDRLAERGVRTFVAYPGLDHPPLPLAGSSAEAIHRAFRVGPGGGTAEARRLIRELGVSVLYMADRPAWHPGYAALRREGVHGIVVHDHTSGTRTEPVGIKRAVKRLRRRIPGTLADRVIAVSDFVARRVEHVDLVPRDRIVRVWNSIIVDDDDPAAESLASTGIRAELGLPPDKPIILVACRAADYKGVRHVLDAFEELDRSRMEHPEWPALIYAGDGPALEGLRERRAGLRHAEDVHLLGYRTNVPKLIDACTLCVVPSVWAEAFGLAALEPMKHRRAVIASAVGGLPEVVADGETGLLVPPGDAWALSAAMAALLGDEERRRLFGAAGRRRVLAHFERGAQIDRLTEILAGRFAPGALDP